MEERLPVRFDDNAVAAQRLAITVMAPLDRCPTDTQESAAALSDVCDAGPLGRIRPACGE